MSRFDIYRVRSRLVLDVQSELTEGLPTRIAVPLLPRAHAAIATELNPIFIIDGVEFALMVELLAAIPRRELGVPYASLAADRDAITRALDLLFTGF